jgi:hypothetical protein
LLAGDSGHRAEHPLVDDVAPAELRLDHGAAPSGLLVLRRHARKPWCTPEARRRNARAPAAPGR